MPPLYTANPFAFTLFFFFFVSNFFFLYCFRGGSADAAALQQTSGSCGLMSETGPLDSGYFYQTASPDQSDGKKKKQQKNTPVKKKRSRKRDLIPMEGK